MADIIVLKRAAAQEKVSKAPKKAEMLLWTLRAAVLARRTAFTVESSGFTNTARVVQSSICQIFSFLHPWRFRTSSLAVYAWPKPDSVVLARKTEDFARKMQLAVLKGAPSLRFAPDSLSA